MTELNLQVAASYDDAMRIVGSDYYSRTTKGNSCGDISEASHSSRAGFRFQSVTVPNGATIAAAHISLTPRNTATTFPTTYVYAEAEDDPGEFGTTGGAFDTRIANLTTAYGTWTPVAWATGNWYDSSDIASVIQEIVNRGGWASGQAMVIFWKDADGWGGTANEIVAQSYDNSSATAPKLHIEYTTAAAAFKGSRGVIIG